MNSFGINSFLDDLKFTCKSRKIDLVFCNTKTVEIEKGIRCSGYFDHVGREIVIGKKREDWLQLLVHESCHMDQWIADTRIWKADNVVGTQNFDKWILGREVSNIRTAVKNIINLELDCDKRAVAKIIEYDLPINTHTYIQRANAGVMYYNYVYKTRRWVPGAFDQKVWSCFPGKFMPMQYYRGINKETFKIFEKGGL